jgi:hypothetical protein
MVLLYCAALRCSNSGKIMGLFCGRPVKPLYVEDTFIVVLVNQMMNSLLSETQN